MATDKVFGRNKLINTELPHPHDMYGDLPSWQGGRFHRRGAGDVTDSGPARVIATQFRQLILVGFPWRSKISVNPQGQHGADQIPGCKCGPSRDRYSVQHARRHVHRKCTDLARFDSSS